MTPTETAGAFVSLDAAQLRQLWRLPYVSDGVELRNTTTRRIVALSAGEVARLRELGDPAEFWRLSRHPNGELLIAAAATGAS